MMVGDFTRNVCVVMAERKQDLGTRDILETI